MLERVLSLSEMRGLVKENQNRLGEFVARSGEKVVVEQVQWQSIQILKQNYQSLIKVLNEQLSADINNFSLHFILTISSAYLKYNKIDQAKEILKKSQAYVENTHSDALLLTGCLNNLANVQKLKGKHYKSLRISLKALEVMENHMDVLRQKKDKERLREDSVLFLIVIIRCKLTLSVLLSKGDHKYFRRAYELMNYLGHRSCLRYLGKQSVFMKRFRPVDREFHLPIFRTEEKIEKKDDHEGERLILEQLSKIHDILKTKQNPDVIVVNAPSSMESKLLSMNQSDQSIFINNQVKEIFLQEEREIPKIPKSPKQGPKREEKPEILIEERRDTSMQKELQKIEENKGSIVKENPSFQQQRQQSHHYVASESSQVEEVAVEQVTMVAEQIIFIDKWQIKLRHEREKGQSVGCLSIETFRMSTNKKKRQCQIEEIADEKLEKIINQINFEDKLPYELFNEQLSEQEFIEYSIIPYLHVGKEGRVSIHPKSMGLFEPFQMKLFNQDSLVFFNHVRTNLFRLSISPFYSYKSIYLNVQFCPESMLQYFSFEEQINDFLTAVFKSITNDVFKGAPDCIKDKNKTCQVISKSELIEYMKELIVEFQNLIIHREDETSVNQILDNQLFYYKFREISPTKQGIYQLIRYLPGINCFDIYLQNNYYTFSLDGKIKARGNALYKSKDFLQDFGVPLKCSFSKRKLFAYIEIISKKYRLLTFERPFTESDSDAYIENAIMQFPITENCFKTKVVMKNNYFTPITISLLTVNNQFPVGIKVVEYNAEECLSRGFFIHIVPQEWVRPLRRPPPWVNKYLFKAFVSEFDFRRDYFIPEWLERKGFDLLFERILNPGHSLYLQNSINRFIRGKSVIEIFNQKNAS